MQKSFAGTRAEAPAPWDWPSAVLVVMLIQVAAARLVMTGWTDLLFLTQTLAALGSVLGLALAASRFSRRGVYWLAIAYSLVLLPWQLSGAANSDLLFGERLAEVGTRLWESLIQFVSRRPVEDAILFLAIAGLGFWIMGLTAGYYFMRRADLLAAVLPAGIIMLMTQAYDDFVPVRIWALGMYVFLVLLLLGRMYLGQNRARWERERVFVTAEARRDLMNSLLTISVLAVLAAWSLPTTLWSVESASQSWSRFTRPLRERFSNAVSPLESPYGGVAGGDFYGPSMSLGRTAALGDTPVFSVRVEDQGKNVPPRYYWRGHTYNYYSNGKWSTTAAHETDFRPRSDLLALPGTTFQRDEISLTLTVRLSNQGLLYAPAEPFWINRPGLILATITPDQGQDLAAWEAEPTLAWGSRYDVRARIANPTVADLRAAGTDYPEWVNERYLQVPEELLSELQPLAQELTQDQLTPYDKAQAITFFLRQEINYSTSLATPPADRDPVLWMLFGPRQGFCVYYASAEVMMLRTLGIPARMAVGFAQGESSEPGEYLVRKADAHAWPEVYFPGIGWVEFEPTGNQDPLRRPLGTTSTGSAANPSNPAPGLGLGEADGEVLREGRVDETGATGPIAFQDTPAGRALLFGLPILLAASLYFLNHRYGWLQRFPDYVVESYARTSTPPPRWVYRWARWNKLTDIERSFQAVNLSLRWLGFPQARHVTPIARARILQKQLPGASGAIDILLNEHQSSLFSPRPGDPARARKAAAHVIARTLEARTRRVFAFFTGTPGYSDTSS